MYYSKYHNIIGLTAIKQFVFYLTLLFCLLALTSTAYFSSTAFAANIPVFPGAEGFGSDTSAGRGGSVIRVTNLNDSGPGSLRAAVTASGPRVVIFEVSGTINLNSRLDVNNPYITIAGQTAPSPGITLKGGRLSVINTHDVLVQHIRVRLGDQTGGDDDAMRIGAGAYNVVFDHVSVSWGVDENMDVGYKGSHDATISNSIVSEGLSHSHHSKGEHSKGILIAYGERFSVINTVMAHNRARNPVFGKAMDGHNITATAANNVIYNWGSKGSDVNGAITSDTVKQVNIVGNVYISGNDSSNFPIAVEADANTKVYISDNMKDGNVPSDQWSLSSGGESSRVDSPLNWPSGLSAKAVSEVEDYALQNAGARPADRDAVDIRIINNIKNGTGIIIDSQDEVGGWPDPPGVILNTRTLTLPANPNGDDDGDGYTNLEEWLHAFAAEVEGNGDTPPTPPANSLRPPTNLRIIN
jgi:hypothetical protein